MPNPPPPGATWTTRVEPGRGRCLVAATDLPAGAIALAEAPIVWWVDARAQGAVCTHCLKPIVAGSGISCAASGQAYWCGAACAAADAERHGRVRELLAPVTKLRDTDPEWTRLTPDERDEAVTLLHLVAHAVALRAADDPAFTLLWDQAGDVPLSSLDEAQCALVLSALRAAAPECAAAAAPWLDLDFVRGIDQRDKANTFAITVTAAAGGGDDDASERRPHAFGVYPHLTQSNHSCLPTVARFDEIDGGDRPRHAAPPAGASVGVLRDCANDAAALARPPCSLAMRYVTLHAVPAGEELMPSYVPLGDPEPERRSHFASEYGFRCRCRRCALEGADGPAEGPAEGEGEGGGGEDDVDLTYVALFVLKHTCPACMGCMAPLGAADAAPCVCNRCGNERSQQEFIERVEAYFAAEGDEDDNNEDAGGDTCC